MSGREYRYDWQVACLDVKDRTSGLLHSGLWTDCVFTVGPGRVRVAVHRLLLAIASPMFAAMFYGDMAEQHDTIHVVDVQPDAFKALVEYIYTDNVQISSFRLGMDLYYAAEKYMLPHLAKVCAEYLHCNLTVSSACRGYEVGCLFNEQNLVKDSVQMFDYRTKEILNDDNFLDADLATLVKIFSSESINIDTELDLFNALERYARAQDLIVPVAHTTAHTTAHTAAHTKSSDAPKQTKVASDENDKTPLIEPVIKSADMEKKPTDRVRNSVEKDKKPVEEMEKQSGAAESQNTDNKKDALTLRSAIEQIRFLTLTHRQFAEGPAKSALLNREEKYSILLNMSSEDVDTPVPQGFSTSRTHRDASRSEATFRFSVNNFSAQADCLWSDSFLVQQLPWRILMKPNVVQPGDRKFVGLLLKCDGKEDSTKWACHASYELRLIAHPPTEPRKFASAGVEVFNSATRERGFNNCVPWAEVLDAARGLVREDVLTIEATIKVQKTEGV